MWLDIVYFMVELTSIKDSETPLQDISISVLRTLSAESFESLFQKVVSEHARRICDRNKVWERNPIANMEK